MVSKYFVISQDIQCEIFLINPLPFTLLSQMKSNPFKPENNMDQFILILKPEIILKRDRKFFAT